MAGNRELSLCRSEGFVSKSRVCAKRAKVLPRFPYYSIWKTPFGRRYNPFFSSFSEGLAPVMTEGLKWGYINKDGKFVIEPRFDLAGQFTEGFAKVAIGDKLGYIDKQGRYIWKPTR